MRPGRYFVSSYVVTPGRPGRHQAGRLGQLPGATGAVADQGHDAGARRPQGAPHHGQDRPSQREPDHHPRVLPQLGRRLAALGQPHRRSHRDGIYADIRGTLATATSSSATTGAATPARREPVGRRRRHAAPDPGDVLLHEPGRHRRAAGRRRRDGHGAPRSPRRMSPARSRSSGFPTPRARCRKQIFAARQAGAAAVLVHHAASGRWQPSAGIAAARPSRSTRSRRRRQPRSRHGSQRGPATLRWTATASSPFVYNLGFTQDDAFTEARRVRRARQQLGRTESTYRRWVWPPTTWSSRLSERVRRRRQRVRLRSRAASRAQRTELYTAGDIQLAAGTPRGPSRSVR